MILPKGIKRGKNITGAELLDEEEMGNDASEEEDDEVDAEQLLAALSGNILIKTTSQELVKESNSVIGKTVSLAPGKRHSLTNNRVTFFDQFKEKQSLVADNEDIEKGDRFQDELRKGFEKFETAGQQIEMAYQNAERTLKKRIKNEV